MYKTIGNQLIYVQSNDHKVNQFFDGNFNCPISKIISIPDISLTITSGYGSEFINYNVSIEKEPKKIVFRRADYLIEADTDYKNAKIYVHDELALKHALMNLYSAFIVHHDWGLLIHSSCAVENEKAHLFAGQSGVGKSTVAWLSQPRELLSDEATIVKITREGVTVFNSPFNSELSNTGSKECFPLASIQLLYQAPNIKQEKLKKADALIALMDKVFYWAHCPEETKKIMSLLSMLVNQVPAYNLHFKKDPTFWELIS